METTEVSRVRHLVIQVMRGQPIPDAHAEAARRTIRNVCVEASLHGLTTAEVLRAIFKPTMETSSRGCNCPTCQARRNRHRVGEMLEARR